MVLLNAFATTADSKDKVKHSDIKISMETRGHLIWPLEGKKAKRVSPFKRILKKQENTHPKFKLL